MSTLIYNGIELQPIRTHEISRDEIYSDDGTTYLYTKWHFDVFCIYNPGTTSYDFVNRPASIGTHPSVAPGLPVAQADKKPAPITDIAVRSFLRVPRATFTYKVGDTVLL